MLAKGQTKCETTGKLVSVLLQASKIENNAIFGPSRFTFCGSFRNVCVSAEQIVLPPTHPLCSSSALDDSASARSLNGLSLNSSFHYAYKLKF